MDQLKLVRHAIATKRIVEFRREMTSGLSRRVKVDNSKASWIEYELPRNSKIRAFLESENVTRFAQLSTSVELSAQLSVTWGNLYDYGEYIPWHTDSEGTLQILLSVMQPEAGAGGIFQIKHLGNTEQVDLNEGDLLIFNATQILHSTTPINDKNQKRMTAVIRYI